MDASSFDYRLPSEAVAQTPVEPRDSARLLVDCGPGREPDDRTVADLPDLLRSGDLLVVNDTRVLPARLRLIKASGGAVEVLLLERCADGRWEALVKPSRRVAAGTVLYLPGGSAAVEVGDDLGGRRSVRLLDGDAAAGLEPPLLTDHGEVPLPPYIAVALDDPDRYQTVFARHPGSVAAPTAGLHLTADVLDRCRANGVQIESIDLEVGLGTFRPIATDRVEDHTMHAESYRIEVRVMEAVAGARRVVAVGTTTVRALESAAATGRNIGRTDLFIHGDYPWRVVDLLLTNFHVPRSSLLVLVESFVGPRWRDLYDVALDRRYRFLSFGDAMLLQRT